MQRTISEFERFKPEGAVFSSFKLKQGYVAKATGACHKSPCFWDAFGLAYHISGKRFKRADINFSEDQRTT